MAQTYGQVGARVGIQMVARLLQTGQPAMLTQRFGQREAMREHAGDVIKWRRYHPFTPLTAPIHETIPPEAQPLRKTDYQAQLKLYGALVELSTKCVVLHEDNLLDVITRGCGRQMGETVEIVTLNMLKAGTTVFFPGSATSRATVDATITRGLLRQVKRFFERNDAQPMTEILAPSALTNTFGIEESYFVLVHPDLEADVRGITGYLPVTQYSTPNRRIPGEFGAVEGFRFCKTRFLTPWEAAGESGSTYLTGGTSGTGKCDVYPVLALAKDAYGVVRLTGKQAAGIKVLQPGQPRGGDGLGQKGSVGWKIMYACAITFEEGLARMEVAATANPT
jgi:N4-gp56 family major capsid protein